MHREDGTTRSQTAGELPLPSRIGQYRRAYPDATTIRRFPLRNAGSKSRPFNRVDQISLSWYSVGPRNIKKIPFGNKYMPKLIEGGGPRKASSGFGAILLENRATIIHKKKRQSTAPASDQSTDCATTHL
jgi:hypothetical protein